MLRQLNIQINCGNYNPTQEAVTLNLSRINQRLKEMQK